MFFTNRVNALATCLGLALLAVSIDSGCASSASKEASPKSPATTQASTRPVPETVVVELNSEIGAFAPRARGVLRPKPSAKLPRELLAPLGALAEGRESAEPPVLVTIGDTVKYDGAFPGEKGKWDKWDKGVEELIRQTQAEGRPTVYELWKEPDDNKVFKDRLNFFSAWVHTVRNIRAMAPGAVLMGPGISKNDGGWIGEFLKVGKEYAVLPDIVGWHEDGLKHDIGGHVGGTAESFWQDGTNINRVAVSANAAIDNKADAGDPPIFMAQMEKSAKDNAWRPITQWFEFKLTHLFTNELKPRSVYYTYREYAALAGAGRSVKVNGSQTIEGVAVWDGAQRTCRLVLGRNRSRVDAKHVPGDVTLQVKGAVGGTVHVRASRIADSGTKASDGPRAAVEQDVPLKNGEANIRLADFASGDAYVVEVNVRGSPPTTATAPTTKPTTKATSGPSPDPGTNNKGGQAK